MLRLLGILACCLLLAAPLAAQSQCGLVTMVAFPVDRAQFQMVQDFGAPSPRHQGRYHTGEDYYGGRDASYGQPVRAIAEGMITYSSPSGWGRDGGVVIIEHTMPDGSVFYSQYGHMEERLDRPFPPRYACVRAGDIIGSVGNARPAPHLHFEIRVNQPDVPGPGYSWQPPTLLGFRQPSPFVRNWQTWLQPYHRWHLEGGENWIAPPLLTQDGGLLLLNKTRLRYATPDGRVLWRINLGQTAAGLTSAGGVPLLVDTTGVMQAVNPDGTLGEKWQTGVTIQGRLFAAGDLLLVQTADNRLIAFGVDRQSAVWSLDGVPALVRVQSAPSVIGLMTQTNELLSVSPDGKLLDRVQLREPGSMANAQDGSLLAYTQSGLWRIDASGVWSVALADAPTGGETSAVLLANDGRLFLFDGVTLRAYSHDQTPIWQADLADVAGQVELALHGSVILLTSTGGNIIAVHESTGALCNAARVYSDRQALLWHDLDGTGTLRVAVGEQITGMDWQQFLGGCA